jgi:hypothetical protein
MISELFTKRIGIAPALMLVGLACLGLFWAIGSSVDESGVLHEPFVLLPIGWTFIFVGAAIGIIRAAIHAITRTRR